MLQQKGRGLYRLINVTHLSSAKKAGQKKEGKQIDFFFTLYPSKMKLECTISRKGRKSLNIRFIAYLFAGA